MKKQIKKPKGELIIMSIPGAEKPWFIYDRVKRRTLTDGFKTFEAARKYLKDEFGK